MSDEVTEMLMSADDNVDEILEEFETDPEQFVELTDELRDRFFTKMLTARPSNRSRLLTLLTEIRNDEDIVATKEQYGDLRKLKLGNVYAGVKRKAARYNMVKQMLTLLDSRDPDDASAAAAAAATTASSSSSSANKPAPVTSPRGVQSSGSYLLRDSGSIELPGPQSPLPKLLPPAPSVSALASIHKKRVQFSIHDLLDIEGDTDDATFFADLKEYVGSLPSEEQIRYLDLASDEVKENMICAGQYIANYARFRAGEPFRVTLLVIGEAGIGKSCLVNEIHRGALKHKCLEGVGGTSITQDLDSKSVVYRRPVTEEENFSGIEEEFIDVTVEVIDTPGLSRSDMDKPEKMTGLIDAINTRLTDGFSGSKSTVHMVLWCVQGTAGRLPMVDELWVRQLGKLVPIILVWTRAFLPNHIEEFRRWMNDRTLVPIELPFVATIPVYARREETSLGGTMPSFNMPLLGRTIGSTFNIETRAKFEVYRQQLSASTEADFERRRSWSYKVVFGAMASASLVGGSPLPYVDSIGVLAIQSAMVVEINRSYGVSLPKNVVNTMLYTIITGSSTMTLIGSTSLAGALILDFTADTLKLIPGLNIVGQLVSAGIAGGLTAALGVAFIRALEKVVRQYPNLMDVPKDRIEQLLMEEAREQAKLSLNDAAAEVRRNSAAAEEAASQ